MRSLLVACAVVAVSFSACKRRPPPAPERTTAGTSLNVGATAMSPEIHINPQGDGGAMNLQIGNVGVHLPGENERGRAAEREGEAEGQR
jgi:hypothetical protein